MSDDLRRSFNDRAGVGPSNLVIPSVVRESEKGGRLVLDIYSRMLDSNVIFVAGQVEPNMANTIVAQLLHVYYDKIKPVLDEAESTPGGIGGVPDKQRTIKMFINSPGGYVNDGLQIYDAMQLLQSQGVIIETHVTGIAMSMGSVLLVAGSPGHRFAWPSANIMLHQLSGGSQGNAKEMNISNEESQYLNERLKDLYRAHTNMTDSAIETIFTNDYFMRAEEAKRLGIIDQIMYPENNPRVKDMLERQNLRHMNGEEVVRPVKQTRVLRETPPSPAPENN